MFYSFGFLVFFLNLNYKSIIPYFKAFVKRFKGKNEKILKKFFSYKNSQKVYNMRKRLAGGRSQAYKKGRGSVSTAPFLNRQLFLMRFRRHFRISPMDIVRYHTHPKPHNRSYLNLRILIFLLHYHNL